jgi:spore germination cell wall hydrolase CwlJ-like protein
MRKVLIVARLLAMAIGITIVAMLVQAAVKHRTEVIPTTESHLTARNIEKQLTCLAKNIYWEAANEPFEGKVAVAQVTLNRMESGKFPDSVCGVVYQKNIFNSRTVCQFSWFCENNHLVKTVHKAAYKESEEVAKMVLLEGFRLPNLKEALFYHADYVNPRWNKPRIVQIGRHIFYKGNSI